MSKLTELLQRSQTEYMRSREVRGKVLDRVVRESFGLNKSKEAAERFEQGIQRAYPIGGVQEYLEAIRKHQVNSHQIRAFTMAGLVLTEMQLEFAYWMYKADNYDFPSWIGAGGAKGAGKSVVMLGNIALWDCQRWKGISALYVRKTERKAKDQLYKLYDLILWNLKTVRKNTQYIEFPNGSKISIVGYKDENASMNFQGGSEHIVAIEEMPQLSRTAIGNITATLRTESDFRPRLYTAFNPLGISAQYVHDTFIRPHLEEVPIKDRATVFVMADLEQNRHIDVEEYKKVLERSYRGVELEAFLRGNFTIKPNQAFQFNEMVHVRPAIKSKNDLPERTQFFAGLDIGSNHPNVFTLCAQKPNGDYFIVDQLWHRRTPVKTIKKDFFEWLYSYGLTLSEILAIYSGSDAFSRSTHEFSAVADEYSRFGEDEKSISLDRAIVKPGSRLLHSRLLKDLLGDPLGLDSDPPIPPSIFVSSSCTELIKCLTNLPADPNRPEVPKKVDWSPEGDFSDDFYESMIYAIYSFHRGASGGAMSISEMFGSVPSS